MRKALGQGLILPVETQCLFPKQMLGAAEIVETRIATLVVAPRHIEREKHFFGMLAPILHNTPGITDLAEVREAHPPVIKMKFEEVDIDMLFARIESKEVGDDLKNLLDDNILRNGDADTIRSLNGCRVTELIL